MNLMCKAQVPADHMYTNEANFNFLFPRNKTAFSAWISIHQKNILKLNP
jgi:hypothetical protein